MTAPTQILLIEDNPIDQELVRSALDRAERGSFRLDCFSTLQEGLHALASDAVDLVILDLKLADNDGLEGIRHIQAVTPEIPILILTGTEDVALGQAAIQAGAQDFLTKGTFGSQALNRALRYALERAALRSDLLAKNQQLEQAQRLESVGRLVGGVAHDFNNLLVVIMGFAEDALEQLSLTPSLSTDLERISDAAQRGADLTRQLLTYTRQQVHVVNSLSLNEQLSGLEPLLRRLGRADGTLRFELNPAIGNIRCDPCQVDQIVMNLVTNARDAMPEGGEVLIKTEPVHLQKETQRFGVTIPMGDYVELSVQDAGHGIPDEHLDRLFEPFFTTKPAQTGTGLGLATVSAAVKQSQGFIWVESPPEGGTQFLIWFPRHEVEPDSTATPELVLPTNASESGTILIVDDNEELREIFRRVLSRKGYNTFEAESLQEATSQLDSIESPLDLVISDLSLPDGSGRDLAPRLLKDHPNTKRLFISGYAADQSLLLELEVEGSAFRQKPFRPRELLEEVAKLLQMEPS